MTEKTIEELRAELVEAEAKAVAYDVWDEYKAENAWGEVRHIKALIEQLEKNHDHENN